MAAHELALDVDLVVRRPPDDDTSWRERVHRDRFTISANLDMRHVGFVAGPGARNLLQLRVDARIAFMFLPAKRTQQCGIAKRIDETRHAARIAVDLVEALRCKKRLRVTARYRYPMRDIGARVGLVERADMKTQSNALHELLELGRVERVAKFRLAREYDPQHLLLVRLDTGQQADLLEHLLRQVLCLIHDQHDFLAVAVLLDKEHVQHVEQLDLVLLERFESELGQGGLQELGRRQLSLRDHRVNDVVLEFCQE